MPHMVLALYTRKKKLFQHQISYYIYMALQANKVGLFSSFLQWSTSTKDACVNLKFKHVQPSSFDKKPCFKAADEKGFWLMKDLFGKQWESSIYIVFYKRSLVNHAYI